MPEAAAIVLAGGRSSRMGTAKALLPFGGQPLIARIVSRLQTVFDELVVVSSPGQELPPLPATLVHDRVSYQGPVGGISYGLSAANAGLAFITSCDAAFLHLDLVARLISLAPDHDVVVPRWDGRLQPLHAVYRKTVLPELDAQLSRGELRPVYLFDKVRTKVVEEDDVRRIDPDGSSFFNMNTPEDYEEALRRWNRTASCTVELFGTARLIAGASEVSLTIAPDATVAEALAELATVVPGLVGRVISPDGTRLLEGYACNINGLHFVRQDEAKISPGDSILILPADAGG